jgi:hypothetical protein
LAAAGALNCGFKQAGQKWIALTQNDLATQVREYEAVTTEACSRVNDSHTLALADTHRLAQQFIVPGTTSVAHGSAAKINGNGTGSALPGQLQGGAAALHDQQDDKVCTAARIDTVGL